MKLLTHHRSIAFIFLLFLCLSSKKSHGQSLTFSVTAFPACLSAQGNNVITAQVTTTIAGATNYTWSSVSSLGGCSATYTLTAPNGSLVNFTFPCCASYTIFCVAVSGVTPLGNTSGVYNIPCAPTVTVAGLTSICLGHTTTLSANGANSYTWITGSASSSISISPTITTIYTVSGTIGTCTTQAVHTVSVMTPPVITIATVNPVCAGKTTTLTASGGTSYLWIGGPSTPGYTLNPSNTSTYTVMGIVGPCVSTATQVITVLPVPILTITPGIVTVCSGHPVMLTASGASSYTWSNGPTIPQNLVSPGLPTTSYTVTGSTAGCTNTAVKTITPNPTPVISIIPSYAAICPGGSVVLSAFGVQNYTWTPGGSTGTILVSPTTASIYTVTGSNSFGCSDTAMVQVNVFSSVVPAFIYSVGLNGQVNFTNTSTNANSNTTYSWTFGNGLTSTNTSPGTTYTSTGVYTVSLRANSGCGPVTTTQTISITNITPPCSASFTYAPGMTGTYTFMSTSLNQTSSTTYYWDFGNGATYTATGLAGMNPVQNFTNGSYWVTLVVVNVNPACTSTFSINIGVCLAHSDFTTTQIAPNVVNFTSLSSGTLPASTYSWNYGDGQSGTTKNVVHSYASAGIYTVSLIAANGSTCTSISSRTISVAGCSINSNFTHTVTSNGLVKFSNTSTNAWPSTGYYWNFGDGVFSLAANPTHTYTTAGNYYVTLIRVDSLSPSCRDTLTQALNITGISCSANANFTLTPTGISKHWNAIPSYLWNLTAASWSWGDGTFSNTLYASHIYSVAGNYSICLSVTVSCGATASYCYPYSLSKENSDSTQFVYVNVMAPQMSTGIGEASQDNFSYIIYPNPNTGEFKIALEGSNDKDVKINIRNIMGALIYSSEIQSQLGNAPSTIHLESAAKGIYFVTLIQGNKSITRKIVVGD